VAVTLDRVLKSDLKYFFFSARDVKRAVLLAGKKSAVGEDAAFGCHDGPPFFVERLRYACISAGVKPATNMQVNAEIHLGTRSVLEYLLSPVRKVAHKAWRER